MKSKVLQMFAEASYHKTDPGILCPLIEFDNGLKECIYPFDFFVAMGTTGGMTRIQFPLKLAWALT